MFTAKSSYPPDPPPSTYEGPVVPNTGNLGADDLYGFDENEDDSDTTEPDKTSNST